VVGSGRADTDVVFDHEGRRVGTAKLVSPVSKEGGFATAGLSVQDQRWIVACDVSRQTVQERGIGDVGKAATLSEGFLFPADLFEG